MAYEDFVGVISPIEGKLVPDVEGRLMSLSPPGCSDFETGVGGPHSALYCRDEIFSILRCVCVRGWVRCVCMSVCGPL